MKPCSNGKNDQGAYELASDVLAEHVLSVSGLPANGFGIKAPDQPSPAGEGFFANAPATATLTLLVTVYVAFFCATSFLTYWGFGMSAYDIGIHDQALWKLSTCRGFFNTIRGMNIWGDHCWIIMAIIAPLYRIIPRLETLLTVQTIALAVGAFPLAAYAYRRIGSRSAALLLAAAFLLSPALQNMNLENAHPEVLAVPFLLWMVAAAEVEAWPAYGIALLLALFCKEDIALTTFAIGFYVFFRRNRTAGAITMLLSAVYFIFCMKLVLPYWNGSGFFRFQNGYWFSDFWAHKLDPGFYLNIFARPAVGQYAWKLLLPVLGVSLLDPLLLLASLPGLLVNILSGNLYLLGIDYHYNYHTLPIIFVATASGIAKMPRWMRPRYAPAVIPAILILVTSAATNCAWSQAPIMNWGTRLAQQWQYLQDTHDWSRFKKLTTSLPEDPDIPIAASHNLVPALTHRREIYMFPNPWKIVYWGIAGENRPSPERVEWLVLDSRATSQDDSPLVTRLFDSGEFKKIAEDGAWLVAKRVSLPMPPQSTTVDLIAPPPDGDWLHSPPPEEGIRGIVFLEKTPLTSLRPLLGQTPDLEIRTDTLTISETYEELAMSDGQTLRGTDNVRIVFIGKWLARGEGETTIRIHADDGCRVYLDGEVIIDYDGAHALGAEALSKPFRPDKGEHVIIVDYFEWGGDAGLSVEWQDSDGSFKLLKSGVVLP